jgi:hypothetical protein
MEHFSSGASSSGWMTQKYRGSYEFCTVAKNYLALSEEGLDSGLVGVGVT